jgi:uncharacterized integral membrane protein
MLARKMLLAVSSLLTLFILFVCMANFQAVDLTCFGSARPIPLGFLLFGALSAGALTGLSIAQLGRSPAANEQRKLDWQIQDAKLIAEVKSDREKQLEAKIATLETALKQALKKA